MLPTINTGTPRSVTGNAISGAFAASIIAAGISYNYALNKKISKKDVAKKSIKLGLQGGVATGSAIAATNYIGNKQYLKSLLALSVGLAGVYAVDKISALKTKDEEIL
ncbi:MAG: hypothetical protein ACK5LP_04945 [Campylobacteraceae bacterium]